MVHGAVASIPTWLYSVWILAGAVTDGTGAPVSSFTYVGVGRVVQGHTLNYVYATSCGCGVNTFAGQDGDRTGMADTPAGGAATSSSMCHDWADRLVSSTVSNPVAGADLTGSNLVYDANGDITKLADEVFGWDGAGRHVSTSAGDGTSVNVLRDSTDRVVRQTASDAGAAATTTRYGFTGDGDTPDLVLSAGNKITSRILALPGGVVATIPVSGSVAPVMGGNENAYTYPLDPVNAFDLNGQFNIKRAARAVGRAAKTAANAYARANNAIDMFLWNHRDQIAFGLAIASIAAPGVGAIFWAGMAVSAASTAYSCATKDALGCQVGILGLVAGGGGRIAGKLGQRALTQAQAARPALQPGFRYAGPSAAGKGMMEFGKAYEFGSAVLAGAWAIKTLGRS